MDFKEFIENDRENKNKEKFEGTFLDYLQIVKENPDIAKLAHKRMYDIIKDRGIEVLKAEENPRIKRIYGNETITRYGFLKDSFYGIDNVLYNKLKVWRRNRASIEGIKPYIIFSDATLIEICNSLPKSKEELINLRGIGEKKIQKYGEDIIGIISKNRQ